MESVEYFWLNKRKDTQFFTTLALLRLFDKQVMVVIN